MYNHKKIEESYENLTKVRDRISRYSCLRDSRTHKNGELSQSTDADDKTDSKGSRTERLRARITKESVFDMSNIREKLTSIKEQESGLDVLSTRNNSEQLVLEYRSKHNLNAFSATPSKVSFKEQPKHNSEAVLPQDEQPLSRAVDK